MAGYISNSLDSVSSSVNSTCPGRNIDILKDGTAGTNHSVGGSMKCKFRTFVFLYFCILLKEVDLSD